MKRVQYKIVGLALLLLCLSCGKDPVAPVVPDQEQEQEQEQDDPNTPKITISILGDSYSAFPGTLPTNFEEYGSWYKNGQTNSHNDGTTTYVNDVKSVNQMWWKLLLNNLKKAELAVNNSFQGSPVCNHLVTLENRPAGYEYLEVGYDFTPISFLTRAVAPGSLKNPADQKDPDIIIIFGGTNDQRYNAVLTSENPDIRTFNWAFINLVVYLYEHYPEAEIVNVVNPDVFAANAAIRDGISETSVNVSDYLREVDALHIPIEPVVLDLTAEDLVLGHPTVAGMEKIKDQLLEKSNTLKAYKK